MIVAESCIHAEQRCPGTLLIRADASPEIGGGHAMRCFALAKAWQEAGGRVLLAATLVISAIKERFERDDIQVLTLNARPGSAQDAEQTRELALRNGVSWIVVDGYHFDTSYLVEVKQSGTPVLMLDDDARLSEYPCDLILNQNLSAAPELYGRQGVYPRLLLGTSFTLLRPEFLQMRIARKSSTVARRLLVSMGAGDRENVTQIVVNALPALRNKMNVVVVIGPGNPHKKAIRAATAHLQNVQIVHDPPDMALLMRNSDIAISGAGSTCWELAYMGVPMVLAVLASNQRPIAQALERSGAAINLGDSARLSTARIADCVDRLAEDGDRRRKMSQAGRKCVDGRGAQRIVEILRSHS